MQSSLLARFDPVFEHGSAQAFRDQGLVAIRAKIARYEFQTSEHLRDELLAFWDAAIAKYSDEVDLQKHAKFMRSFTAHRWDPSVPLVHYCCQEGCILENNHRGSCQLMVEAKRKRTAPTHYQDVPNTRPRKAPAPTPAAPVVCERPSAPPVPDEQLKGALHARFVVVEATDPVVENRAWFATQLQEIMQTDERMAASEGLLQAMRFRLSRAQADKVVALEALQAAKRDLAAAERDLADCDADSGRAVEAAREHADAGFQHTIEQITVLRLDPRQFAAVVRDNLAKCDAEVEAARAQHADKKRECEAALAQARREARALL